ncbi:MAG: polyphosphate kinase 2 family protein [Planctomycetota bacterium]
MFEAPAHPDLVPFDGSFQLAAVSTHPGSERPRGKEAKKLLKKMKPELDELQRILYAHDSHAVLLVFQAMDAAGKDSTIRAVLRGLDPTGFQVFSFKQPSKEEVDHDFLWRTARCLPERGRMGVFNRSYYEEVLVVRVHPQWLDAQRLPEPAPEPMFWEERFDSIRDHELHLARNGTVVLKFWLNVSREEQCRRFLDRLDEPEKNWKFAIGDVEERASFDAYMSAYEEALRSTSRPWAPWYAIPADDKPALRLAVATALRDSLRSLEMHWPVVKPEHAEKFAALRAQLEAEREASEEGSR